jgi:hypothetical protein
MIPEAYFLEIVREVCAEYLPKTKGLERKEFSLALLDELKSAGIEFEDPIDEDAFVDVSDED